MMLLLPVPRIAKSFIISNALLPSPSLHSNTSESRITNSNSSSNSISMVDYLVDSLGFSKQEAIASSSNYKVKTRHKSTTNPDLVVNVFRDFGLDDSQIRDIVSSVPKILSCNDKILEPKIRVFRDLGLSGWDLVEVLKANRNFIQVGLHSQIIPGIDFFKKLLGSDEKVIQAIIHSQWLSSSNMKRMSANIVLLQKYGLSSEKIATLICKRYIILHLRPEWFRDKLHYIEVNLGISRDSPMFFYGLYTVVSVSKSTIKKKIRVFKSFGWSDSEIYALLKVQPFCLGKSEAGLRDKLNFFMKELEYTPNYLTRYAGIFNLSMEKRMKPRYEILKILKAKNLVNSKPTFVTLAQYREPQFLRFMQRFEYEVPNLIETYRTSIEKATKAK